MKICIDPGHGMSNALPGRFDPGAVAGGHREADIALQWALSLKWALVDNHDVFLTRVNSTDPCPVAYRASRAHSAKCDLFISLHCNAGLPLASGVETFYRDSVDRKLAELAQSATVSAMQRSNRGVKHESRSARKQLAVLRFPGPACLLEIGFISNFTDRRRMLDREVRMAWAMNMRNVIRSWR